MTIDIVSERAEVSSELNVEMELVMLISCVWHTFPMFGAISKDAGKLFSNTSRAEANISDVLLPRA